VIVPERGHGNFWNRGNQTAMEDALGDFIPALPNRPEQVNQLRDRCVGKPVKLVS
jgi:hypothetical protein